MEPKLKFMDGSLMFREAGKKEFIKVLEDITEDQFELILETVNEWITGGLSFNDFDLNTVVQVLLETQASKQFWVC
jgi:hypothetical protein